MASVKTAISIDEELFEQMEALASELGVSRSEVFRIAAKTLLEKYRSREMAKTLDEVYGSEDPRTDTDKLFVEASARNFFDTVANEW